MDAHQKLAVLKEYLKGLGSIAVAFSGGVDSTFLLAVSHDVLFDKVIAITASAPVFPAREQEEASTFCHSLGIRQLCFEADVLADPAFCSNPPDRCYICKHQIFKKIIDIACKNGINYVCEGSNMDDTRDYRPGMKAVRELGIKSPLMECGLYKAEIRLLSKEMGLPTWDKPSCACLASRFAYGDKITPKKLYMVEQAEDVLHSLGFRQLRVRLHGDNLARLEVLPEDFPRLMECRTSVTEKLKKLGFAYVALDLAGYRTGSMNEVLDGRKNS